MLCQCDDQDWPVGEEDCIISDIEEKLQDAEYKVMQCKQVIAALVMLYGKPYISFEGPTGLEIEIPESVMERAFFDCQVFADYDTNRRVLKLFRPGKGTFTAEEIGRAFCEMREPRHE